MKISNVQLYLYVKRIREPGHDAAYTLEFLHVRVVTCHKKWTVPETKKSQTKISVQPRAQSQFKWETLLCMELNH